MSVCQVSGLLPLALMLAAAFGTLAGCGGKAEVKAVSPPPAAPPPTEILVDCTATRRLNLNPAGEAAPLLVRLYELADAGTFMAGDYFRLLENDKGALGSDLLGREELRLSPGQERTIRKEVTPATRYIGVFAAYRVTDGARWRAVARVVPHTVNLYRCELGPRELKLTPGE